MKPSLFLFYSLISVILFYGWTAEAQVLKYDEESPVADQVAKENHLPTSREEVDMIQLISLTEKSNKIGQTLSPEDNSCLACTFAYAGTQQSVEFEKPEQCGPQRNYLDGQLEEFKKNDPTHSYVKTRKDKELKEAQVPRKCVTYIMRSFIEAGSQLEPTDSFASCPKKGGVPRQGNYKACVSEDYVNLMYNSFVDVTDCLGLPQKSILPKFQLESGFHINAFGAFRVADNNDKSVKNLLDVRVCNPKNSKVKKISDLKVCKADQNAALLKKENEAKLTMSPAEFKVWKTNNVVRLRDIFDHKAADDSWFDDLTSSLKDRKKCTTRFVENFCGHDLSIVGGDTGVGQFTAVAADEASKKWKEASQEIKTSSKASCQRIAKIPGVFTPISSEITQRCDLIRAPPNPVTALLMYGSFYKAQEATVLKNWENKRFRGKSIDALMKEAKIESFDKEKIVEMLTIMAYNAGPTEPVIMLGTWLESRIQNIKNAPVTKLDFDFGQALTELTKKKTPTEVDALKAEFKTLSAKKKKSKADKERLNVLSSAKVDRMDFSNYVKVYRAGTAKGYLKYIKDAADRLDTTFGKGVCTSENFLSL